MPRVTELKRSSKDAKTRLQEWLQGRGLPLPVYELTDSYGEDHAKTFDVSCCIDEPEPIRVEGRGGSRRAAEQDAAEAVLRRLLEKKNER
jgi:ribonuclease-3